MGKIKVFVWEKKLNFNFGSKQIMAAIEYFVEISFFPKHFMVP